MGRSTGNIYSVSKRQNTPGIKRRRFRPYPEYKDSGAEWPGKIPANWKVRPLKFVAPLIKDRIDGIVLEIPYIGLEHIESRTGKMVRAAEYGPSEEQVAEGPDTRFRSGDVLFGKLRPYLAKVLLASFDGRCSSEFLVLRSGGEISPAFLAYQLLSPGFIAWINAMTYGTKMPRVSPGQVMSTSTAIPDADEQSAISTFLARETAKIDALIEKKERLIGLLQEKRTALITQAVTKGLDPTVPMKDSGVEWLGKIPAHWEVLSLKRLGVFRAGAGFPDDEQGMIDEALPFFKVGDLARSEDGKHLNIAPNSISKETARRLRGYVFPVGAIVFAKVGAALKLNRRRILTRPACIDNNMMGFINYRCDRDWAFRLLCCLDLGELANPGAVPSVNEGQAREIQAAVPLIDEQRAIGSLLDREIAKIDALVSKIRIAIIFLREYRAALVSAAVTGRIDVRKIVS